ncbi:insulin-like peptide receptor [Lucilia sericata]|uniref:insulin-like peptide receptor n=1 Tax=Lucilia sericata TaxID=13632 RepID=UPI0018A82DDA|nr:insulin-like peptide receptor [Lucilia sericata]XP_037809697.1 insulin-like peptide receptor [Lucilia sericata]
MRHTTAVALTERFSDRNNSPETGVFVTHFANTITTTTIKTCAKSSYLKHTTLLLLLSLLLHTQQCLATYDSTPLATSTTNTNFDFYKSPSSTSPYECGSLDLRNDCDNFYKLTNCTVITGFLDMAQLPRNNAQCNFSEYRFENLREITDFLIFSEVRNLSSIKNMFPNLSVIRGQHLFVNYALVVTSMPDLEKIEFKSLIAIQRGHVLLDANPKLCSTEKINWTRLTLRPGVNSIFLDDKAQCPVEAKCNGCKRDSCWSNDVCQKIENDSVISLMQDTSQCHELCLGGCYNRTAQGCVVCKGYTDHGTCVKECPQDKYASRHYLRCYTREECVNNKRQYIFKTTCVDSCPSGYQLNRATYECDSCGGVNSCQKVCKGKPTENGGLITISNLMCADNIRGCQILNASVMIDINEFIDQQDLYENFKDVREIIGHLKINRSPYLTSLNFFKNLEKIHGSILENNQYALIIYNNNNLSELWNVKEGFELVNGGMYIHANDRLCNRRIRQFRERVKHDNNLDSFQTSDQEVLCSPAKLNLYVEVLNHRSLKFYWFKNQTLAEVEIIYKPVADKELITEKSELDTDVCNRINWRRELKFPHELQENSTHYIYIIQNLEPHTRYAGLVKTFNGEDDTLEARSEIKYATTQFDIPTAPMIRLKAKTYDTLSIEFSHNDLSQVVDYYILEVYALPDDKEILDSRDYCDEPVVNYKDNSLEDYEDCCTRREEERKDRMFLSQLREEFSCSLDHPEYCKQNTQEFNDTQEYEAILTKRFEAWESNYTIRSLARFHLYVLQVKACNHAGCSSFNMLSVRTNYSTAADKVYDFTACRMPHINDYRVHFSEPQLPNGYITSYALHFRHHIPNNSSNLTVDHNYLTCITRLEHERHNYLFTAHSNYSYNQAAVRVISLGHSTFIGWFNITICPTTKMAGGSSQGWNIFFVFFLIGAGGTVLWICYKRRYWRKIPQLKRYLPLHISWRYLRPEPDTSDDRQILVEGFETVRFHNSPDEDKKYLVHLGKRN